MQLLLRGNKINNCVLFNRWRVRESVFTNEAKLVQFAEIASFPGHEFVTRAAQFHGKYHSHEIMARFVLPNYR